MTGHLIELNDGSYPTYWSLSEHSLSPAGCWGDKPSAVAFARPEDAKAFIEVHLRHQAELCKIVPHDFG